MTRQRLKILLLASLGLLLLWAWHSRVASRRNADTALLFAYVDGPVNDYAMGLTRSLPLRRSKGAAAELAEAKADLKHSAQGLGQILASARPGWLKDLLAQALPLHQQAAQMAEALPLKAQDEAAWLDQEEALGAKLIFSLETMRYEADQEGAVPQGRFLELNALIYSLKEAQDQALP